MANHVFRDARFAQPQLKGLRQRSPGKRAKSLSQEQSSAPCSMARAARWASEVRFPPVPSGNIRSRSTRRCCGVGWMAMTAGCSNQAPTTSSAVSTLKGEWKMPVFVVTRRKARRTFQAGPGFGAGDRTFDPRFRLAMERGVLVDGGRSAGLHRQGSFAQSQLPNQVFVFNGFGCGQGFVPAQILCGPQ
jgi:hypothetical protein